MSAGGMYREAVLSQVASLYSLGLQRIRRDLEITGSPERSAFRVVIEDGKGDLFVLERIAPETVARKKRIAETLTLLAGKGLFGVQPYLCDSRGEQIVAHDGGCWQIRPFVNGIILPRPEWVTHRWRGRALADFMIALRGASQDIPHQHKATFSIVQYIDDLLAKVERYQPDLIEAIEPALAFLQTRFMEAHNGLPVAFCHGDYHPLNIVWSADEIKAVIDWEFSGVKPELYDIANLVGCVGIEEPEGLVGELIQAFIPSLKEAGIISEHSWQYLLEFVVAIRFAWLSEWLRTADKEMIEMETDYMELLVDNADALRSAWGI